MKWLGQVEVNRQELGSGRGRRPHGYHFKELEANRVIAALMINCK